MTPEQFDQCFKKAHTYWKRAERVKHWDEYREIYMQELGQFPPVVLTEALGRCFSSCQYFPDIREIKNEMINVTTDKTEGSSGTPLNTNLHIECERELDAMFGLKFEGYTKYDIPPDCLQLVQDCHKKATNIANKGFGGDTGFAIDIARALLWEGFVRL